MEEKYESETLEHFDWAEESDPEKETVRDEAKQSPVEEDSALKGLLRVDERYLPLLTLLEQFCPGEDGIQFNRKLRNFENTISSMCPDEERLHQAFATLRAAALLNAETTRKLAAVGVAVTRQTGQRLRIAFLNVILQETFGKLDVLEKSDPIYLINATNLMGDYFAEATLANGKKLQYLASPLVQYVRALLASDDIRAHRSMAAQLMLNGRELLSELPQEMDELSVSIRVRLIASALSNKTWLLLSADVCLFNFKPLPATLQKFYKEQTEEEEVEVEACKIVEKVSRNRAPEEHTKYEGSLPAETPIVITDLKKRLDLNSWRESLRRQGDEFNSSLVVGRITPSSAMSMSTHQGRNRPRTKNGDGQLVRTTRMSGKEEGGLIQTPPRSHITRPKKYWAHDDRCEKNYNS